MMEGSSGHRDTAMGASLTAPGDPPNPAYKMTGETGSYRFMAPEVFR
jgi:hypothetical protein